MADSLEKIARDISRLGCDFPTDGTYDEQAKSLGFVRLLMYNCILFDRLYSCAKNGACKTCKAYEAICTAEKNGGGIAREIGFWRRLLKVGNISTNQLPTTNRPTTNPPTTKEENR